MKHTEGVGGGAQDGSHVARMEFLSICMIVGPSIELDPVK